MLRTPTFPILAVGLISNYSLSGSLAQTERAFLPVIINSPPPQELESYADTSFGYTASDSSYKLPPEEKPDKDNFIPQRELQNPRQDYPAKRKKLRNRNKLAKASRKRNR